MAELTNYVRVVVLGSPRGQERARASRSGHVFTSTKQRRYAESIVDCWREQGGDYLPSGPYKVLVTAVMARPKGHFRTNGQLSKAGLESKWPTRKPDASNCLKQIDALVKAGAFPDDSAAVDEHAIKLWAQDDDDECLIIQAWVME